MTEKFIDGFQKDIFTCQILKKLQQNVQKHPEYNKHNTKVHTQTFNRD